MNDPQQSRTRDADGPLSGVRVVAFEQAIAAPFASCILAEMGADVVKIERPGEGDVVRGWDDAVRGLSSGFVAFNMGKRDICVDAAKPEGRTIIERLAKDADVFIENFAPGVAERLGIGYAALSAANERLIYCSLSGYGQDGPYRDVKAFDLLVQGESGILLSNGSEDSPAKVAMPITDLIAGSHIVMGVLSALYERESTGTGRYIDVSLLDSALFWQGYFPHQWWHWGREAPRTGMRHQFICPYGPFTASDGEYVNLVVASQEHWRRFCASVVEMPQWAEDERFATMADRSRNRVALDALVEEVIRTRSSSEWFARLSDAGLPHGRVRPMAEVVEHPQIEHRRLIVEDESPVGSIPLVRFPLSSKSSRPVPALGEHTEEVLREIGYAESEISSLRDGGVI